MPLYIKSVAAAAAPEVLAHRVLWAFVLLAALCVGLGQRAALRALAADGGTMRVLALSSALIALNWLVYIYAVVTGRVLETSLGYYMTPLVNVLLGVLALGERLDPPVRAAAALAGAAVIWLATGAAQVPWIALTLAASFGLYGLLRKRARVGALVGLTAETAFLLPAAVGYLAWRAARGRSAFLDGGPGLTVLLMLSGPVTAVPLLCFAGAARRLPLSTLGFVQYLSPTLQLLLAVLLYGEPFDRTRLVAFALIWTALVIFAVHTARRTAPEPIRDV